MAARDAVGSVALSKRSSRRDHIKIAEPEQAMYGVMGPQYADYLATTAANQSPGASAALAAGNAWALRNNYDRDQQSYANMLKRAQDLQAASQDKEIKGGLLELILENYPEFAKVGGAGLLGKAFEGDPYGVLGTVGGENETRNLIGRNDRRVASGEEADRYKTMVDAAVAGAPYGIVPTKPTLETQLRNPEADPLEANPELTYEHIAPLQENTIYGTDQGLTAEQQLEKARLGGSADEGAVTVSHGASGNVPTVTYKGTTEQIAAQRAEAIRQGINPNTQAPFTAAERAAMAEEIRAATQGARTPNADAPGGSASATPAARTTVHNTKPARTVTVDLNAGQNDATANFWSDKKITSREGTRNDPFTGRKKQHQGTDYAGYKRGTPIPAEGDGQVVAVENPSQTGGYGNRVKIRYNNGEVRSYAHNDRNLVKVGDAVKRGQPIGTVGSTGRSTGPHVHVRTERAGINPEEVYANRLRGNQKVDRVEIAGGYTVAYMKDGTKRVYQKGKRVG